MSKKSNINAKKAGPTPGSALETQFWNCLKKGNVEGLEEVLLCRKEDSETGAVTFAINHEAAHLLVNTPNAKKVNPLSYAVGQKMDEHGLHLLLRAGANVDASDGAAERSTALHAACWGEDDIAVGLLLRCGANPLVSDVDGRTPLHVLALLNAVALFSYVLETATTCKKEHQKGLLFLEGRTPVVVTPFELLSKRDLAEFTVLHTAASDISSGSDHVVLELLDYMEGMAKTDPVAVKQLVNMTTESGASALHLILSCRSCNEEVIIRATEQLLELGANPAATDKWGHTALSLLVTTRLGSSPARVLRVLLLAVLERCDKSQLEHLFLQHDVESGYTLIHHAIVSRNVEAVKIMVDFLKSVDEANAPTQIEHWLGGALTKDNKTVVSMLVEHACNEIAQLLLNVHAIEEVTYEHCREKYEKQKDKDERERRAQVTEEKVNNSSEGDHGKTKDTGDFSGFGSTSVGSRVQQARKARSKATAQKRKQTRNQFDKENEGGNLGKRSDKNWLIMVFIVLVVLSMVLRSLNFF